MKACPSKLPIENIKIENHEDLIPCEDKNIKINDDLHGTRRNFTDFYIIGKIWVEALSIALVGEKVSIIPNISASNPEEPSKKPPPLKYKDLPMYKSPHSEYKESEDTKYKCAEANTKILHNFLLPYVRHYRTEFRRKFCDAKCVIVNEIKSAKKAVNNSKEQFKETMRDPDRLEMRQAVLATGGIVGYLIGTSGGISRRILFTGLGLLSAGALCFPKETDEVFWKIARNTGKVCVFIYNQVSSDELSLREKVDCKVDQRPPVADKLLIKCPTKK